MSGLASNPATDKSPDPLGRPEHHKKKFSIFLFSFLQKNLKNMI
jgi:hypothetical protein